MIVMGFEVPIRLGAGGDQRRSSCAGAGGHDVAPRTEPISEKTRLALGLRPGVANIFPILRGDCDFCGQGPRVLAWTKDSLRLCVECALSECVECGGKDDWHYQGCSSMTVMELTMLEDRL